MAKLWNLIDKKNFSEEKKMTLFLFCSCLLGCVFGFVAWLIVSNFALRTFVWAVCFTGYAGFFIGYVGGFIYLCRK